MTTMPKQPRGNAGLWGMPVLLRTPVVFGWALISAIGGLFLFPTGLIPPDLGSTTLTVSTFLFGIIAGFYIYITSTDYVHVKDLIASENAAWISLSRSIALYEPSAARRFALHVDAYLRRTPDYEIIDYPRQTTAEFDAVAHVVLHLPLKAELASLHQVIMTELDTVTLVRQQLTVLGTKTLSSFSWLVLFALASLVVMSLYGLRNGEVFLDVVAVLVSSAIALLFCLIRDLDLYIWNERTFGFELEANVFRAIGKSPYYPAEAIASGRIHPKDFPYRIGTFVNYPHSLERRVSIHRG